ncbi:putative nucleolar 27S pre-rRNA processing, Urb2/Npa2 [Rosa chinensis]|uniref:Putative nucleolar 27S pre-rRNA processing, Urb2/Npa2 n=1 Tax=Rosa chinensis TaxID=74649 RepID=A0A2P6PJB3_ROSCH|nr:putative nucleolar 27S pre-rRNA processing, Urb2/Npa2 [Rosa chinensis]
MAHSGANLKQRQPKKNKKKRKQSGPEESERPPKTNRTSSSENENEPQGQNFEVGKAEEPNQGGPWRNLELILSIQNRELDLHKKVELAHGFVMSRVKEEGGSSDEDNQAVNMSRIIIFVNDWVQSLLISEGKKVESGGEKHQAEVIYAYLDLRCWEIFKFCLEESLKLNVSLSFSRNLLRSICWIARSALSLLNKTSIGEGLQLYATVLDCISLVFSSQEGFSNENLDMWITTVSSVLDLGHKFYSEALVSGNEGVFRAHARNDGFRDFSNKLLEPLLHLLGLLHLQIGGSNPGWTRKLLKLVEDVLSHGLYHPLHIDGFLSLCSTEKDATSNDGKSKDSKTINQSYHRHLFDKVEGILAAKNEFAVESIVVLFHLLTDQVKKLKRDSALTASTKMMRKSEGSRQFEDGSLGQTSMMSSESRIVEKNYCSTSFNPGTRKSLHDFFVLIMEPLLLEINGFLETKLKVGPELLDIHCTLKAINNVLLVFMHEKIYVRTEDASEGASLKFLKKVYNIIISLSSDLIQLSVTHSDSFTLIANEVLSAIGYLLEINYDVLENDLVSLWLMILSYWAIGLSLVDSPDRCSLFPKITDIGCELIMLYSQLRQDCCWRLIRLSECFILIFRLFVSCQKALRCIITACEETVASRTSDTVLFEDLFPVSWLYKSVHMVSGLQESFFKDIYHQVHDMILELMDHTFYVFLTLNKYQSNHAVRFLEVAELNFGCAQEQRSLLNLSNYIEAWKSVNVVAKILKEQMQILLVNVKNGICNAEEEVSIDALNLNKFASIISCFSWFLWGLACVVINTDGRNSDEKAKLSRWKLEPISQLNLCIKCSLKKTGLKDANSVVSVLTAVDSFELQSLNKPLLRNMLKGDFPNATFLLRQLLIASSAILRLNLHIKSAHMLSSLVHKFAGIMQVLLLESADAIQVPYFYYFVCLDGVLKYLEELGNHFPLTNPTLSRDLLRSSFAVFIKKSTELHLQSAVQAIERALVGVREGCTVRYDICAGSEDGGRVSSIVASGIDCLDLVLEFVSGRNLIVVKKYIQRLIACMLNVILHLQSPLIFYERFTLSKDDSDPDPGTVILMCVDVLERISGKHAIYKMDLWHDSSTSPNNQPSDPVASVHVSGIDRQYSIGLYSACCRLLHNVVKHHKSECEGYVALLQASVRVLLYCLETLDAVVVAREGFFSWEVEEGVKCACSLRRIYEELRHQKEVFGPHCYHFLAYYIRVYSGYGPRKTGIKREIDEALRPGVYALIDVCSPDDLLRLHATFGEGPCTNTLATLKHDYELNFQYQGKV